MTKVALYTKDGKRLMHRQAVLETLDVTPRRLRQIRAAGLVTYVAEGWYDALSVNRYKRTRKVGRPKTKGAKR